MTALLAAVLAACGGDAGGTALAVERRGEHFYDEGAHGFVVVRGDEGELVLDASFDDEQVAAGMRVEEALPPGRYTVESFMRPCLAACPPDGTLDPPAAACDAEVVLRDGEPVTVVVLHDGRADTCTAEIRP